ncbi:hypothetical protein BLOT_016452 [Blomia tropicalis]|nr:hypothetical protein BLOT_016452 [Blomia tropicalis]
MNGRKKRVRELLVELNGDANKNTRHDDDYSRAARSIGETNRTKSYCVLNKRNVQINVIHTA